MASTINFDEIEIFDNGISDLEILRIIINKRKSEEPLQTLNVGDVLMKHRVWKEKFPRIVPYYAVKCNSNPIVIRLLAVLGANFDCASKEEITQVMRQGVSSNRIIFAHPIKFSSHIEYAKEVGVSMMTVDTENEIKRIKLIYPRAKILIRIRCDTEVTTTRLGDKFGCDPEEGALKLINSTIAHGMELCGFSFHAGSPSREPSGICRGINWCKNLIHTARSLGCTNANIIDIGGGIPGTHGFNLDQFSGKINAELKHVDPSIAIIAEPGRYYVTSACMAAACIINKKVIIKEEKKILMYYVTDGVHGSFTGELLQVEKRHPVVLRYVSEKKHVEEKDNKKFISIIWGPTADSHDCILKDAFLPEVEIGDWLVWFNVGAYTISASSRFNGFKPAVEYPMMKRADWISMWREINDEKYISNKPLLQSAIMNL